MNGYTFKQLDRSLSGSIPDHTCPDINSVIDIMEELRKSNDQLRTAAEYWKSECETVSDERDDLENKLDSANQEISDLKKELGGISK